MSARSSTWHCTGAPIERAPPRWSGCALPMITRVAPPSASAAWRIFGPSGFEAASKIATPSSSRMRKTLIFSGMPSVSRQIPSATATGVARARVVIDGAYHVGRREQGEMAPSRPRDPASCRDAPTRHADRRGACRAGRARLRGARAGDRRRDRRPAGGLVRRRSPDRAAGRPCAAVGRVGRAGLRLAAARDRPLDAGDGRGEDGRRRDVRAQPHAPVQPAAGRRLPPRGAGVHAPLQAGARVQPVERAEPRDPPAELGAAADRRRTTAPCARCVGRARCSAPTSSTTLASGRGCARISTSSSRGGRPSSGACTTTSTSTRPRAGARARCCASRPASSGSPRPGRSSAEPSRRRPRTATGGC